MAVTQHQHIMIASGVLASTLWGGHALQTVTIARNTPRNPVQAVGYKGIVDFTSAAATSDITLDCILTEGGALASGALSSVYVYADVSTGYVLTSCNIGFTQGAPATVAFGYQYAGDAAGFVAQASPAASNGDVFAVVLGDDGNGLLINNASGAVASGVQSISFASTVNRTQVLDVRSITPIEIITTYPLDITMNLETFATFSLLGSSVISVSKASSALDMYARIAGLQQVSRNESINVGGYLTNTYSFIGSDLWLPLGVL